MRKELYFKQRGFKPDRTGGMASTGQHEGAMLAPVNVRKYAQWRMTSSWTPVCMLELRGAFHSFCEERIIHQLFISVQNDNQNDQTMDVLEASVYGLGMNMK